MEAGQGSSTSQTPDGGRSNVGAGPNGVSQEILIVKSYAGNGVQQAAEEWTFLTSFARRKNRLRAAPLGIYFWRPQQGLQNDAILFRFLLQRSHLLCTCLRRVNNKFDAN